ncbi:MAG TPA: hypothetical protein VG028_06575 [Terriglobia bacterium]|nr:hypothetical protein [Terriglobia bacterium]
MACAAFYTFLFDFEPHFLVKPAMGRGEASLHHRIIFSFFAAPGLLPYWIDGHIWKVRSDPDLKYYLKH